MNPVSYQGMLASMNSGHPSLVLDRLLSSANVKSCSKCGFATTDAAELKKHMLEHGTRFYCFYCNKVSFSEAELNAHLKQHKTSQPFKCPHCGQGYMRRMCLIKHIDRLHSKSIIHGPAKTGTTKIPNVPVSNALSNVPTVDPPSVRPVVRVTVPTPCTPAVRQGKDELRGKTLDSNVSHVTNGNAEFLAPLNGLIQHNRALTVSLPEEVTIPAGCLVELVEVKTVNGTKELKLRLVSQQENESVIKDTRTTVSASTALGKPFLSSLNHPNPVKSMSMGMGTVNRKQCETKKVNVEVPAAVPVNYSKKPSNPKSKEKVGLKRTQEKINLECHTVIPNKIPKSILNPVREGNGGIKIPKSNLNPVREVNSGIKVTQSEPVNHNAALPSVISNRLVNRLTSSLHPENMEAYVSQRAVDKRVPPRRTNDPEISPQATPLAVKLEPGEIRLKNNTSSKIKEEPVGLNQQKSDSSSLSIILASGTQQRTPTVLVCKDNVASKSFSVPKILSQSPSIRTDSKMSAWTQGFKSNERPGEGDMPEPESFPIISSVFSLSQRPEDVQDSMQPLVRALRGIVMDKSSNTAGTSQNHVKITNSTEQEEKVSAYCDQEDTKDGSIIQKPFLTKPSSEPVKVEGQDKGIQHPPPQTHNHIHVKKEKNSTMTTKDIKEHSQAPAPKSSSDKESVSVSKTEAHVMPESQQEVAKSESDIPSKFLTVSLKRVQVGVWKKSKKGLKPRIAKTHVPMGSLTDCTVIYPMPLKKDQLVKRPSPYQPVVVLNHPKPRSSVQTPRADTVVDTRASEVAPKCHILKMRLSKVMGQKYEVMGCTVGSP